MDTLKFRSIYVTPNRIISRAELLDETEEAKGRPREWSFRLFVIFLGSEANPKSKLILYCLTIHSSIHLSSNLNSLQKIYGSIR